MTDICTDNIVDAAMADGGRQSALKLVFSDEAAGRGTVEVMDAPVGTAATFDMSDMTAAIPCFTPGSRIATARGEVLVDKLLPGDAVVTRDNGVRPVFWTGTTRLTWQALGLNPLLRPVRIRAGALGPDLPEHDLVVSPNHRMLMMKGRDEVLVQARDLAGRDGIECLAPHAIEYIQILLSRHEAVLVNGAWSESFAVTAASRATLPPSTRSAIFWVAPELAVTPHAPLRPAVAADDDLACVA